MSQDKNEQEPEKVVAINDDPPALTANMAAASKLASRLRAAGANLPQEVWQAIEEGRTQDFQNHPDFMAATHLMMFGQVSSKPEGRIWCTATACARCRGLHAEGSCLVGPETRWQRFRSVLVKLWEKFPFSVPTGGGLSPRTMTAQRKRRSLPIWGPSASSLMLIPDLESQILTGGRRCSPSPAASAKRSS